MAEGTVTIKGRADLGQLNRAVDKLDSRVQKVDRSATSMRASLRAAGTALVGLGAAVGRRRVVQEQVADWGGDLDGPPGGLGRAP